MIGESSRGQFAEADQAELRATEAKEKGEDVVAKEGVGDQLKNEAPEGKEDLEAKKQELEAKSKELNDRWQKHIQHCKTIKFQRKSLSERINVLINTMFEKEKASKKRTDEESFVSSIVLELNSNPADTGALDELRRSNKEALAAGKALNDETEKFNQDLWAYSLVSGDTKSASASESEEGEFYKKNVVYNGDKRTIAEEARLDAFTKRDALEHDVLKLLDLDVK